MKLSIHAELLWLAGFLYLALIGGICAVLTFLVLTERAAATRHTRATCEVQLAQKKIERNEPARVRQRGE